MEKEEKKEQKVDLEEEGVGGSHLDLTFISGADPLSGVNSLPGWLWNREQLYACLLQCSADKIRFQSIGGLRERLERRVFSSLH